MKKFLLLAVLFCFCTGAFAQKVYFVYIQSEAATPFYVKIGEKVYSSTATGYLILPKLVDSTYSFYLGQPGNQSKELRFTVSLNNKDRGFLLKNLQNGWVLFDLQSMATVNPTASTSGVMYQTDVVKNDMFTRLLAKAVDDSTLLMEPLLAGKENTKKNTVQPQSKPVTKKQNDDHSNDVAASNPAIEEQKKSETANPDSVSQNLVAQNQSVVNTSEQSSAAQTSAPETIPPATTDQVASVQAAPIKADSAKTTNANQTATDQNINTPASASQTAASSESILVNTSSENIQPTEYKRSVVKRYAESSNFQGFGLTYIDTWEGITDTVRLVIPNIVEANYSATLPKSVETQQVATDNKEKGNLVTIAENSNSASTSQIKSSDTSTKATVGVKDAGADASCKTTASDRDFAELKKNMAARARGEEMLAEARKTFNEKCFTTEQIRNSSNLFLTSEGKFLFFKDAKPHISDKDRFETLIFEFSEDSYKDRFRTLLNN